MTNVSGTIEQIDVEDQYQMEMPNGDQQEEQGMVDHYNKSSPGFTKQNARYDLKIDSNPLK